MVARIILVCDKCEATPAEACLLRVRETEFTAHLCEQCRGPAVKLFTEAGARPKAQGFSRFVGPARYERYRKQ